MNQVLTGRGHTGGGRDSYASVKWPGGPSHLGRARLVGAGACGVREDSANARGGGAGVCAHGGGGDVLSVVRDEGARAAAMVIGPIARARDLGVALEAVEERHGARGDAAHRLDDEHPDAVAFADSVCV